MMTFEELMKRALEKVPDDMDKREGSPIYLALAPACFELAEMYVALEHMLDLAMIDTSEGIYLDRIAKQYSINRLESTCTERKLHTSTDSEMFTLENGTRLQVQDIIFEVTEKLEEGLYRVASKQAGEKANSVYGSALPLDYVPHLISAVIGEVIIYGEDIEEDDTLRKRIQDALSKTAADGNCDQYKQWASEYEGIGRVKVFPQWLGGNTVKISVTDAVNQIASSELIDAFQAYLDPQSRGLGNGKAPIGAKVTVSTGVKRAIDIRCEVKLAQGYITPEGIADSIIKLLSDAAYAKDVISYMQVGSTILNLPSISEIRNLFLCGNQVDLVLESEEIPMLEDLNVVVF